MNLLHPISFIRALQGLSRLKKSISSADYLLLDTPMHKNIGDLAIAYAERQFIHNCLGKVFTEITAQELGSCEKSFARSTPTTKTVLIHGGGFLGSLWPQEEYRFREIVKSFKNHKIVVFPQTVTFDTATPEGQLYLDQSRKIYNSHPDIHICLRDARSFDYIITNFPNVKASLIPDMALQLKLPDTAVSCEQFREGALLCMRNDHEKSLTRTDENILHQLVETNFDLVTSTDMCATLIPSSVKQSEDIVIEKAREFSSAKLIVTDRLHGMILAALTGTPCIALNNSNKKVEAVYQWVKSLDYITCVNNASEAKYAFNKLDLERSYKYNYNLTAPYYKKLENIILEK